MKPIFALAPEPSGHIPAENRRGYFEADASMREIAAAIRPALQDPIESSARTAEDFAIIDLQEIVRRVDALFEEVERDWPASGAERTVPLPRALQLVGIDRNRFNYLLPGLRSGLRDTKRGAARELTRDNVLELAFLAKLTSYGMRIA